MRATKFLLIIFLTMSTLSVQARDQDWGIFQFLHKTQDNHLFMAEWLRRDDGALFEQRFFDYFRFSYGKNLGSGFTYLFGAGHVNFENRPDETRFHQFLIYKYQLSSYFLSLNRFGLEERLFKGDSNLYLRARIRNQIDPLPNHAWGVSVYNEVFFVQQGLGKFYSGLNENRFGFGPRYNTQGFELYLYLVKTYLRNVKNRKTHPTWGQLQMRLSF